jgi:hypothetical protein
MTLADGEQEVDYLTLDDALAGGWVQVTEVSDVNWPTANGGNCTRAWPRRTGAGSHGSGSVRHEYPEGAAFETRRGASERGDVGVASRPTRALACDHAERGTGRPSVDAG